MLNLNEYMKKVGVTKKKYVDEWLAEGLIPGVALDPSTQQHVFPESARRPYKCGSLKPGAKAHKLRAHIVKACINRQHIMCKTCFMSEGEFNEMISALVDAGWIKPRVEDGITYYDSTGKSDTYSSKSVKVLEKLIAGSVGLVVEAATRGAVSAYFA